MINISLPHIAIQKVENGFVVVWQRPATDEEKKKSSQPHIQVCKIATTDVELVAVIKEASLVT